MDATNRREREANSCRQKQIKVAVDAFVGSGEKGLFGRSLTNVKTRAVWGHAVCGKHPFVCRSFHLSGNLVMLIMIDLRFSSRAPIQSIKEQSEFCRDFHPKCNFQNGN